MAKPGKGAVFKFIVFKLFFLFNSIEDLSTFILQPIFFKTFSSVVKCFGSIFLIFIFPLVIAAAHKYENASILSPITSC